MTQSGRQEQRGTDRMDSCEAGFTIKSGVPVWAERDECSREVQVRRLREHRCLQECQKLGLRLAGQRTRVPCVSQGMEMMERFESSGGGAGEPKPSLHP